MADTDRLRQLIQRFEFYSRPSSANGSSPCTVDDLNKLISNLSKLLKAFVDELEEK